MFDGDAAAAIYSNASLRRQRVSPAGGACHLPLFVAQRSGVVQRLFYYGRSEG